MTKKEYNKIWREKNKEYIKEKSKIYYAQNKERIKIQKKEYLIRNKDKIHKKQREYYNQNPEKWRKWQAEYKKKPSYKFYRYGADAKRRGYEFLLTMEQFMSFWGKSCVYCEENIETIGLDRIDNEKGYVMDNVVSCCPDCNYMKSQKTIIEFKKKCKKIWKCLEAIDSPFPKHLRDEA